MADYREQYEKGCEEISLDEICHRLGRSADTVKTWVRGGHVAWGQFIPPSHKGGNGTWVFRRRAFEAWCAGGLPEIKPEIVIKDRDAYDALCRVAVMQIGGRI